MSRKKKPKMWLYRHHNTYIAAKAGVISHFTVTLSAQSEIKLRINKAQVGLLQYNLHYVFFFYNNNIKLTQANKILTQAVSV